VGASLAEVKVTMETGMKLNCSLTKSRTTSTEVKSTTPDTPEILNQILNILPPAGTHQRKDSEEGESVRKEDEEAKEKEIKFSDCMFERNSELGQELSEGNEENKETVRAALKMRVKRKRQYSDCNNGEFEEGFLFEKAYNQGLTVDDDVRRQRRRDRNKVAATKCRNKKKERTTRLIAEGEVMEIQNECLKDEMMRLELEHKHLTTMLSKHEPSCGKKIKREDSNEKICYEDKSSFYNVNANKNNSIHINNNNNNSVYSDCKYKVKEEDRFYENDNSVSDASPVGDDIYLDDFSESFVGVEDYSHNQKQDWYHPHYWHQRQTFPLNQGGIMPCQGYTNTWQADYECMTL